MLLAFKPKRSLRMGIERRSMFRKSFALLLVAATALSFATTCLSFNTDVQTCARTRVRTGAGDPRSCPPSAFSSHGHILDHWGVRGRSRLRLFGPLLQKEGSKGAGWKGWPSNKKSPLHRIPDGELDFLAGGFGIGDASPPPFPYSIDLLPAADGKRSNQPTTIVIRHLEDDDIKKVMPEVVREFGALAPSPSTGSKSGDELAEKIENYLFSLTVLIGLTQRVVRREKGYARDNSARPDHDVICLVERTPSDNANGNGAIGDTGSSGVPFAEQIVGIAEVSWQPPNPNANAPPFVLPYFAKALISRFSPSRDGTSSTSPRAYVSNVLVWKARRGRGYSRALMAALEGIARSWGCDDVRLHVDANEFSGRIARSLYWSLGYEGVPDRGTSRVDDVGYDWMGPHMANQGLYLVDGVPLLYLCKNLKDC
ncbi:hypothetical protein ACHAWF_006344 [Thalassiosira exigua]